MNAAGGAAGRESIPPGQVSRIRGHYQAPVLGWLARMLIGLGLVGTVLDDDARILMGTVTVVAVVAAPLLRVGWLVVRWRQESDGRFVALGLGVLAVVGVGATLAALGLG